MTTPHEQQDADGKVLPVHRCWACGYQMDAASCVKGDHRPDVGDFSICFKCGEVGVFDDGMAIREPLLAELVSSPVEVHRVLDILQKRIRQTRPLK